jgi:hypothetical protein
MWQNHGAGFMVLCAIVKPIGFTVASVSSLLTLNLVISYEK